MAGGFPAGFAGAGTGLDEDIGAFVRAVKAEGFAVTLVQAAQWGTETRNEVRRWLTTKNRASLPACLAPMVTDHDESKTAGVVPGGAASSPQASASPSLADRGPAESAPARAKKDARAALDVAEKKGETVEPVNTVIEVRRGDGSHADTVKTVSAETQRAFTEAMKPQAPPAPVERRNAEPELGSDEEEEDAKPPPKPAEMSDQYARFITTVMEELDMEAEYNELEPALEIGDDRRDYTTLNAEVDRADKRAWRAMKIWGQAAAAHERLKLDQKEVDADLWKRAMTRLEKEGGKTRIADVDAKIAELFPDEWRAGKSRVKNSEIAVELAKGFADRWNQRARALSGMLGACRK